MMNITKKEQQSKQKQYTVELNYDVIQGTNLCGVDINEGRNNRGV